MTRVERRAAPAQIARVGVGAAESADDVSRVRIDICNVPAEARAEDDRLKRESDLPIARREIGPLLEDVSESRVQSRVRRRDSTGRRNNARRPREHGPTGLARKAKANAW